MDLLVATLAFPILILISLGCTPARFANTHSVLMRRLATGAVGSEFLIALAVAIALIASGSHSRSVSLLDWTVEPSVGFGFYVDGPAGLMLLLVGFIGFVVSRFSIRYLDGEATQGNYFRWLGFTIGAVSLMVVAGNLMLFFASWVMTSFGLHHLLLHYRHRPAAHRAAWTKFAISRLGDGLLIGALILTYQTFGTLDLASLFAEAEQISAGSRIAASHAAIAWLLILGAVTKSAQFPFHTWLPDTLETPTPVSALMHAGVVNAGGYLVIRLSPLVTLAPAALLTLAIIGAVTACFAGVVMMTQASIKRTLAYSTIAQMGFMMLQCGLGAFSAAMLHIVAHSLYKAHAFLTSGSVISQMQATGGAAVPTPGKAAKVAYLLAAAGTAVTACYSTSVALGVNLATKPGGLVLGFVLCLALTAWGWRLFSLESSRTTIVGLGGIFGLCLAYLASYLAVDRLLATSVSAVTVPDCPPLVSLGIVVAFCGLFALHLLTRAKTGPTWLAPLRVHAVNGFYVDALYHRVFGSLAKS